MKEHSSRLSRRLARILRHDPGSIGITLDPGGWVAVNVLLAALKARGIRVTGEQLSEVVAANDKQRFAIVDGRIRAQQGHSVPIDLGLEAAVPPPPLYHGTARRNLGSILAEGLIRGRRHHVHLSADRATALRVGTRHGRPVVLTVDTAAMIAAGHRFYRSGNGVWLTDRVPVEYLTIEASPTG